MQGWFTPGQIFVLDEYCARYGVRSCFRHLRYLEDLLDRSEKNVLVDPTLIHFSYAYCASHVHGNRYVNCIIMVLFSIQNLLTTFLFLTKTRQNINSCIKYMSCDQNHQISRVFNFQMSKKCLLFD